MEALQSFDNQEQIQHNPEKEKQAIEWDYNNTLDSLSSAEFSTTDIQDTISMLSENNPIIASRLSSFQLHNTSALENMLASHNEKIQECSIEDSELSNYFWIESLSYFELKEQLDELWLDITVLMTGYQEHIENKLWDLPQEVKQKVILSIWMRISSLSTIVADIYHKTNSEDFKNNRWIINSKLQEELWFVNNELLPSLEAYSKIQSGTQVPDKYNQTIFWEVDLDNVTRYSRPNYSANPDYINMDFKLKEIEQLMWAKIDEDGDFVEAKFGLYTQSIFDMNNSADNNLMNDLWVQQIDASLLSPEDMKIEEQAMLYFMAAIAVQVWVETVWAIPGMVVGWWVDLYDTFSSEETLLGIVQAAGLVNTDFKMEKTWVDNVLAWLWLIPWATQIIKGSKLAKYMDNVDMKAFEVAKQKVKEKLWMWNIKTIDRSKLQEDIPRENMQLREIKWFQDIPPQLLLKAEWELQEVIGNIRYNSFEKIDLLMQSYLQNKTEWVTMLDSFKKLDLTDVDKLRGTNCVWMSSVLQNKLQEMWIESHIIRFDAWGLINNAYVENGHWALIIPRMIGGVKHFTLMDPGLLISKPITFAEGKDSKIFQISEKQYIIKSEWEWELPYLLEVTANKNPSFKQELHFDPHHEWINPGDTLNKDIMRAAGKFKLMKQNPDGKPQFVFITDINSEKIILKVWKQKKELSYDQFRNIKEDSELHNIYTEVISQLWENPEIFYNRNMDIINNLQEYKDTIWAPSTREIINNQK